jgi:hypothetical protein
MSCLLASHLLGSSDVNAYGVIVFPMDDRTSIYQITALLLIEQLAELSYLVVRRQERDTQ